MKVTVFSELLLLTAILALAWFLYVQQAQLAELEVELDRMRGAYPPVPAADPGHNASAAVVVPAAAARPKPTRKPKASE